MQPYRRNYVLWTIFRSFLQGVSANGPKISGGEGGDLNVKMVYGQQTMNCFMPST